MNRMFDRSFPFLNHNQDVFQRFGRMDPEIAMDETDDAYIVTINTATMDPDSLNIEVNRHSITITGESRSASKTEDRGRLRYSQALSQIHKTIPLPVDAVIEDMITEHNDERVVVTIPKR
jgi:HSP20 family protein